MKETTIDVRGARVRALEAGDGDPLLYLHGVDGPRADPLFVELAKTRRVIAPEIPGFGRSPIPDWMFSVADVALFGLDLVDALGFDHLHLAGHSIGGWIATEMAIRHPTPFATLSLLAPMGLVPEKPGFDLFAPAPDIAARAQFHDAGLAERELAARAGEDIDILLQNRMGLARLGWTPRFASVQLPWWLHRVKAPTLLLWGEQDRIVPVDCLEAFRRGIPRAEVARFSGCGHALPFERGAEAAAKINSFIAGARR